MKTLLQRLAAATGFIMLLATPAIETCPAAVIAWLSASAVLLFAGRGFTFQQK